MHRDWIGGQLDPGSLVVISQSVMRFQIMLVDILCAPQVLLSPHMRRKSNAFPKNFTGLGISKPPLTLPEILHRMTGIGMTDVFTNKQRNASATTLKFSCSTCIVDPRIRSVSMNVLVCILCDSFQYLKKPCHTENMSKYVNR